MSSYSYSSLPASGEDIRLLRLLPSEDEAAPLHCKLRDYSLRRSTPRTHLYEAISYVWGDPHNTLPIYVDKKQFQVTVNLHAALLRLRDHSFERILWIDAICINQNNNEERRQQVQLMARIYNSASRVVVWLGEEIEETKGALEDIQVASNEAPGKNSKEVVKKEHIIKFLQNPWFQRIWVLQEVAAAQHVVIVCGSMTIAGSAFCVGVKSLELSYTDFPELQTLPSVIDLIERAGLRPKFKANSREKFSLNIRSLAELIDMFHTRQATDRRDKVYALLGMSSDAPETAGIQPSYENSWEELFQQVVKFTLGKHISVRIFSQRNMIQCRGVILGWVSSVERDDRQHVTIGSRPKVPVLDHELNWTVQASANPIQKHDIIFLLYGASKPSIIRLCEDHFAVVVIAATPLDRESHVEWPQLSQSQISSLRNILLVWDWGNTSGKIQDGREYKSLTKKFSQVSVFSREESGGHLEKAIRLWNDIAILDDLQEWDEADERLIGAQDEYYLAAFGEMPSSYESVDTSGRTILAFAAGKGHEDIVKLLLNKIHPDVRDGKTGCRALSLAAKNGHEAIVKLLLVTGQVDADLKDCWQQTPLSQAAQKGHEAVVKLLLATDQVEVNSKDEEDRTPLFWATRKGHENIVKLLLATGQVDADSKDYFKKTPLLKAAGNGHENIVKLLLKLT
ncbi:hypothetical protein BGAL_0075g00340 [Botrytis galanthina]|uniref:Heterokaryon incompatibility domain-containing protein n=1 Tax=Botrytis galanthina TaxID=278940 RepID=A0A4S8R414_9HELO|nr:hypothetical protein BGAL_0075g00340 [Botrytis galanthina]